LRQASGKPVSDDQIRRLSLLLFTYIALVQLGLFCLLCFLYGKKALVNLTPQSLAPRNWADSALVFAYVAGATFLATALIWPRVIIRRRRPARGTGATLPLAQLIIP